MPGDSVSRQVRVACNNALDPVDHAVGLERQAEEENDVPCRITPSFGPAEGVVEKVPGMGRNNEIQFTAQHQGGNRRQEGCYVERIGTRALKGELLEPGAGDFATGLALGAAYVELPEGTSFKGDPKVIWSALVWAIYGVLLVVHWKFDQRGRRYAWSAIVAFGFVILTFWGTNLLPGIHNPAP